MILATVLSALVPIGIEGIKQVITRFAGGVKATTIDEQIKLDASDVARLEAIAKMDAPIGTPSQWVVDLRASCRYIAALVVIGAGILSVYIPGLAPSVVLVALEAANIAFGFLFGTRVAAGLSALATRK